MKRNCLKCKGDNLWKKKDWQRSRGNNLREDVNKKDLKTREWQEKNKDRSNK